jgi:hypothetical protein
MRYITILFILSGLAVGQAAMSSATPSSSTTKATPADEEQTPASTVDLLPKVPPLPKGKTTLIGGTLVKVDRVRDEIEVRPFGGRRTNVQFDERTSIYQDGQKASPRDLKVGYSVYLDTMSDGNQVFARSIRLHAQSRDGEVVGQIVSYEPGRGKLTLRDSLSPEPVVLRVPAVTVITGGSSNSAMSELRPGALISAKFNSNGAGEGVAQEIKILALPGGSFAFSGRIEYLDLRTNLLELVDPRDQKTYEVHFAPATRDDLERLHEGDDVMVVAHFDGTRYEASSVMVNSAPGK